MTYEEFFTFFYPTLYVLGILLSMIPAYIAFRKNKSFWIWWLSTAAIFAILLFILIKTQAVSKVIYLLAILPAVSILALFPKMKTFVLPVSLVGITSTDSYLNRNRKVRVLVTTLIVGAVLYCSLIFMNRDSLDTINKVYFITSAMVFLIACLGFARFVFVVSERAITEIILYMVLVLFLALPIFLKPLRAYDIGFSFGRVISNSIYIGPVITDLMYDSPIAGIFVLFGICSGCVALAILLNDKYKIVSIMLATIRQTIINAPYIHFSRNPFLSTYILVGVFLFGLFVKDFNLGEAGMFLWPLYYICVGFPMILISFTGIILSSIVIAISTSQNKLPYAVVVLLCGLFASWKGISTHFLIDYFGPAGTLLMSYSLGAGFVALILWLISDHVGRYNDESRMNV